VGDDAGPTHTEVLVRGPEVEVCEVNHRFGGLELLQGVSLALGQDVAGLLLSWAAGATDLEPDPTPRRVVPQQCLVAPPGAVPPPPPAPRPLGGPAPPPPDPGRPAPGGTALGYCGICRAFYEYRAGEAAPAPVRCPLCGYYAGDC